MVTSECILVTHSLTPSNLTAGTYLDPGDPQLAALPSWAQQNQCSISPLLAVLFFSSFTILCTMFTMSLVVGVIIDNFEQTFSDDDRKVGGWRWGCGNMADGVAAKAGCRGGQAFGTLLWPPAKPGHRVRLAWMAPHPGPLAALPSQMTGSISQFAETWAEFDPGATHFMPVRALPLLLARLDAPLGCRGAPSQGRALLKLLKDAPIPVHHPGERVRFRLPAFTGL
jgi:hypothetical protein